MCIYVCVCIHAVGVCLYVLVFDSSTGKRGLGDIEEICGEQGLCSCKCLPGESDF